MASLFERFQKGLQKTATTLSRGIAGLFTDVKKWGPESFDSLEKVLLESDIGIHAAKRIVADIRDRYDRGMLQGSDDIRRIAIEDLAAQLNQGLRPIKMNPDGLTVLLFVGVNGSGKTTSAGKLACRWAKQGRKVMLGACDTFRAAASEQLKLWAERSGSAIVSSQAGADPAAVAFDAVKSALAREMDILILDTAGRQQNKKNLMDELAKIRRIVAKQLPDAPHETILTIDASLGTNALSQAREFASITGASALLLTKLDGTGKGGAAAAVQQEFGLPILFVGMGEGEDDLHEFVPQDYAEAIFQENPV